MSQLTRILFHPLPGLLVFLLAVPSALGDELGVAVQAAIRKVEPSIVRLRVIGGEQSIDGNDVRSLVTTGIVISEDGEILTSQFALEGKPEAVLIEDQTGKRTNAKIVATDSVRRIVLLKAQEGRWTPAIKNALFKEGIKCHAAGDLNHSSKQVEANRIAPPGVGISNERQRCDAIGKFFKA